MFKFRNAINSKKNFNNKRIKLEVFHFKHAPSSCFPAVVSFFFVTYSLLSGLADGPKEQTQDLDWKTMFNEINKMKVEVVRVELVQLND